MERIEQRNRFKSLWNHSRIISILNVLIVNSLQLFFEQMNLIHDQYQCSVFSSAAAINIVTKLKRGKQNTENIFDDGWHQNNARAYANGITFQFSYLIRCITYFTIVNARVGYFFDSLFNAQSLIFFFSERRKQKWI